MVTNVHITPLSYFRLARICLLTASALLAMPGQAQGQVGEWQFSDNSGTMATDSSGYGHTAALVNGIQWIAGQDGGGVSADATKHQYISIPAIDLSRSKAVTITLWVNRTYSAEGGHVLFEATPDYSHSTTSFTFLPDDESCHGIQAALHGNAGYAANCYSQPSSGAWHHFAVVFDKRQTAGDEVRVFLDGVLQIPTRSLLAATNTNDFGDNPIYLFARGGKALFDSGEVADFRIYNTALTAAQVQEIYFSGESASLASTPAGAQQQANVSGIPGGSLNTPAPTGWQLGFDFRNTAGFVTDPSGDTYVLPTMAYPTKTNGVTFGWLSTSLVQGRNRNAALDPRLAGINFVNNGTPATFDVDLPSAGTYSLVLALGDAGYESCWVKCQVQFLDGGTVLATVTGGTINMGYFYDAKDGVWSAAAWPNNNLSQQVTLAGTRLTVVVGTSKSTGDSTPIAFLGVSQVAPPNFTLSASPASLSIRQGNQGTSTITTTISGGFNSSIALSASGVPSGTTVSFNPNPIPAPGSGSSAMTITVGSSTPLGTYPITVTGNGGGLQQNTTVTLTVTGSSIILDGHVHGVQDNGLTVSATGTVSIGTPTAGDLITCEVTFDSGNGNTLVTVSDNNNGAYAAAVPVHLNSSLGQWFGIYYKENVAPSPTGITLTTSQAQGYLAIACQAWKGVATSNSLDSGFSQLQDAVSTPNPTTGSNKTPAVNGELIVAAVGLHTSGTPTAGVSYALVDGASTTQWWPEYWIQTTATPTAGNYTWPTDTWTDMMAGFKPPPIGSFTMSASPASLSIPQGNQGTSTITTTISGGFNSSIALSASGVPSGTTVSFNPNPIAAPGSGSATMTIIVGGSTPTGTYPITVTGNGGGIQQNVTVTLTVIADPDFTISAAPGSVTILRGNQGTSTITTAIIGSFNSSISLSASGMPSGTTVTFNPNTIPAPGSGNSTMTIAVGSSTKTGTYAITVTGNGGGNQHSVTVTLTVVAQVSLSWTASTSPGVAGYNMYSSMTSGGPYTKLNPSLITTTSYYDQTVQSGFTYYYVATSVNAQGQESTYSNQATATVQ